MMRCVDRFGRLHIVGLLGLVQLSARDEDKVSTTTVARDEGKLT